VRHSLFGFIRHLLARPRAILFFALRVAHSIFLWGIITFLGCFILGDLVIPLMQLFVRQKKELPHRWLVFWSRILLFFSLIRVEVFGRENVPPDRPLIIVANHQSHFDYPLLFTSVPLRFAYIVKKELFSVPFVGRYFRISGYYALDRRAAASAYHTMNEVAEALKGGDTILIFPEGTRTMDGSVGQFKGGVLKLAFGSGVPVLPVAISGAFGILRRFTWQVNPSRVYIKIGKPIHFDKMDDVPNEVLNAAISTVQNAVAEMYKEMEEKRLAAKEKHHPAPKTT
jgi:1-acyl-sn-glycerol-3-phosphate acyltransferase